MIQTQIPVFFVNGADVMVVELLNTTGKRMERLRKDKHLNQIDLANMVNVRQNYISAIENDNATPSAEVMAAIARALDTTLDFLMMLSDVAQTPADNAPTYIAPETAAAAKIIDDFPPKGRMACLNMLRSYKADYEHYLRRRNATHNMLESIEINYGKEARGTVEKFLRNEAQGFLGLGGGQKGWDLFDEPDE